MRGTRADGTATRSAGGTCSPTSTTATSAPPPSRRCGRRAVLNSSVRSGARPAVRRARLDTSGRDGLRHGRHSTRRGSVWVVLGDPDGRFLLFDQPGDGVHPRRARRGRAGTGRAPRPARCTRSPSTCPGVNRPRRTTSPRRPGRSTYSSAGVRRLEILGAPQRAVDLAVEHATIREQFGRRSAPSRPSATSRAKTDCIAVDSATARWPC